MAAQRTKERPLLDKGAFNGGAKDERKPPLHKGA